MELLEFAFSGFWSFVATLFVLSTIFIGVKNIIIAFRKPVIIEEKED